MGKKDKKKKKSEHKLLANETVLETIKFGTGRFVMENGDTYKGEYCAHRIGLVWREGRGVYKTHDGQIYEGYWKDDCLVNNTEAIIKFPNKQSYTGRVAKNKANGPGTFMLENKMEVCCQFVDNKPVQNVVLIDLQRHVWEGHAEKNGCLLFPENIFYKVLTPDCGKGELKVEKVPIKYNPPPLKLCKPDENIFQMPDVGGYVFTKSDCRNFTIEDTQYFNVVDSETEIPKPPKQLDAEFIPYDRVFGMRRRYFKKSKQPEDTLLPTESLAIAKSSSLVVADETELKDIQISKKSIISNLEQQQQKEEDDAATAAAVAEPPECALTDAEMKGLVFGKSGKTSFEGVHSYEAKHVQDYLNFKRKKQEIMDIIDEVGRDGLTGDQKEWLKKWQRFVKKQRMRKLRNVTDDNRKVDTSLLDQYYSKEWRSKWPVIKVFIPTETKKETEKETNNLDDEN